MNWIIDGVIYPPYLRRYDERKEGRENWLHRINQASWRAKLREDNGTKIECTVPFEDEVFGQVENEVAGDNS